MKKAPSSALLILVCREGPIKLKRPFFQKKKKTGFLKKGATLFLFWAELFSCVFALFSKTGPKREKRPFSKQKPKKFFFFFFFRRSSSLAQKPLFQKRGPKERKGLFQNLNPKNLKVQAF